MILFLIIFFVSWFAIGWSVAEIYIIMKIFKDEFGCFSLDSLLTGEWESENLKTGKVTHHVASREISKQLVVIFLALFSIAMILDGILK